MNFRIDRGWQRARRLLALTVLLLPTLGVCAKKELLPVAIHGVNYSGNHFSYIVQDPQDESNSGGGESVAPYAAGGIMCCYELPRAWTAEIKIKVDAKHWVKNEKGDFTEIAETKTIELPPYVDGKPGELWVIRAADGTLSVISSDYQPDNPKWPGAVKGWPVPSVAYRGERRVAAVKEAQMYLDSSTRGLAKLKQDPTNFAKEYWDSDKKYNAKDIVNFTGPEDRRYVDYLRSKLEEIRGRSERTINELKDH
ncbi:DUF3304 domain-containing protein [Duganella sp. BJB488]|uniref:DUF3304 domain-containing protein n=1 Tax=unclassified Duganella TaxID=2636909 RepID=UPI000E350004|nr:MULTISPECIES: DUF3304 domain-containing protein [unclassified Duganella]RFP17667.1 DUF3304 domain-containing protein [Duganella sp. BJB489]RFP22176.1 DUF3304 domain-containing protein [Duganella sp. BJB488]RFP37511.1 DUF3304 domain-containing protein [Duganella sp. BJB480]